MSRSLLLVLLLLLVGCAAPAPSGPPETPIALSGQGDLKTPPLHLNGGTYRVDWAMNPPANASGCLQIAWLMQPGASDVVSHLTNNNVRGATPSKGSTYAYNVPSGTYYVQMLADCPWQLSLTPQ